MSNIGHGQPSPVTTTYGRGDLQAAFNWLINQPEHIRKQATDPDRLMTLFFRSSQRTESRTESKSENRTETKTETRIEVEAPVSSQNFISDLRQIHDALRQFDGNSGLTHPVGQAPTYGPANQPPHPAQHQNHQPPVYGQAPNYAPPQYQPQTEPKPSPAALAVSSLHPRTLAVIQELREKLNLTSDAEAMNVLAAVAYKHLRGLLG